MGHEAIVYGRIVGASGEVGERFRGLQERNHDALSVVMGATTPGA